MSLGLSLVSVMWLSMTNIPAATLSPDLAAWLGDRGSMTQRLKENAKHVNVHVLQHEWQSVDESDATFLNIPSQSQAIIREVILYGDEQPLIYAVSIFPESIVKETEKQLLELGDKPLGEVLFSHPDIHRGDIEIAKLDEKQASTLFEKIHLTAPKQSLWARRSTFEYHGKNLSVLEVFLPALLEKIR